MIKLKQNILAGMMLLLLIVFAGQQLWAQEEIHLFPDRSFAVSGDTVWFFVAVHSESPEKTSGVVHVQLDDLASNHITKVTVQCSDKTGRGFIYIPDSLSTGVYLLRPFSLVQKNNGTQAVHQKLLTVYNRFDEEISSVQKPDAKDFKPYTTNNVAISTNKNQYSKREKVNVAIQFPEETTETYNRVFITAALADPSSNEFLNGEIHSEKIEAANSSESLVEKNGVLISGKVNSRSTGKPVPHAIVFLSISDTIPFFDYSVSDSAGAFNFYLRNATGSADLVIQALPVDFNGYEIELDENYIDAGAVTYEREFFTPEETQFAANVIEAAYYKKLFDGYRGSLADNFEMPVQFEYPFYGKPTNSFYPDLFIDLPDFQEISREILSGVQYRERKNDTTIRLVDHGERLLFKKEPLKLIDGIPVFDNSIITPLGTADIKKVDVVNYKRFFGDLTFNGVLSIYSNQPSLNWVDLHPRLAHFKYNCLQPQKEFDFKNREEKNANIPNLNKVFYRSVVNEISPKMNVDFFTSDIKGRIKINVILIDKNNRISFAQKFIEVK